MTIPEGWYPGPLPEPDPDAVPDCTGGNEHQWESIGTKGGVPWSGCPACGGCVPTAALATCDCLDRGSTRIDASGNDLDGLIIHLPGCAFIASQPGVAGEG